MPPQPGYGISTTTLPDPTHDDAVLAGAGAREGDVVALGAGVVEAVGGLEGEPVARGAGIDDDRRWKAPSGIVELDIDPTTGQQSNGRCPDSVTEIFIEGTEPPECETHRGGMDSWVTRLVNWFSRD